MNKVCMYLHILKLRMDLHAYKLQQIDMHMHKYSTKLHLFLQLCYNLHMHKSKQRLTQHLP